VYEASPADAPVKRFEGPSAKADAQMYAATNGGGHVRPLDPATAPVVFAE
jgi:hypothetical protein